MSHTFSSNFISIPHYISPTQKLEKTCTAPKVSFIHRFPKTKSSKSSGCGFRRNPNGILGILRAPRCIGSLGTVENSNINNKNDVSDRPMRSMQTRPFPAETCRTLMELCSEGTLCTFSEDGWPFGTGVEFAVDVQGMPVLCLDPLSLQAQHVVIHNQCSLHVKLEQHRHRKVQCTLMGTLAKPDDKIHKQRLQSIWTRRFGKKINEDHLYVVSVGKILLSQDVGEEGLWVDALEYSKATADPLRNCVAKIVKDMNDKHGEDIYRICNIYTDLDVEVEEASMIWIDRLGFDLHLFTRMQRERVEVRIPFPREVTDEKDARSSLTYMAQLAWEVEKNYAPPEFERVKCIQKLRT